MISEMFQIIGDGISGLATSLSSAVSSVTALFWTAGENGAAGSPTFLGTLTLVGLAGGLIFFGIRFIVRAVKGIA